MISSAPDINQTGATMRNKDVVTAVEAVSSGVPEPVAALFNLFNYSNETGSASGQKSNNSRIEIPDTPEWTAQLEQKFAKWARLKALGQLSLEQVADFEKMSALRRVSVYPRSGEEIIAEYEQRALTNELVRALTKYVEFHREWSSHHQRKTT